MLNANSITIAPRRENNRDIVVKIIDLFDLEVVAPPTRQNFYLLHFSLPNILAKLLSFIRSKIKHFTYFLPTVFRELQMIQNALSRFYHLSLLAAHKKSLSLQQESDVHSYIPSKNAQCTQIFASL